MDSSKGPEAYKPFLINFIQEDDNLTFAKFNRKLRSFEDMDRFRTGSEDDNLKVAAPVSDRRGRERNIQVTGLYVLHVWREWT